MKAGKPEKSKQPKTQKPALNIELPEDSLKCHFQIKKSQVEMLRQYAEFLSEHYGTKVPEDRVIETLVGGLSKDKLFLVWKKGKTNVQSQIAEVKVS